MARSASARGSGPPFAAVIALRYLRSTRRDAFVRFLTIVAAGGLAVGVAALILSLAALTGFQDALKTEILARTPEIAVDVPPAIDADAIAAAVARLDGVVGVRQSIEGRGWILSEGRVRPILIEGFAGELPPSFAEATARTSGLFLPRRLGVNWGLDAGDGVEIASNRPTLTPLGPQPRVLRRPVAGLYRSGRTEQEDRVALPLADAERLLGPVARRVEVDAGGLDAALDLAPRVASTVPAGVRVRTWRELESGLFFALRLEKSVMFVAVSLIVVVAALALVADVHLVIAAKRAELGMLGTLGASPSDLRRVFLLFGAGLAGLGGGLGVTIGLVASHLLDRYRLLRLPPQVYFLDFVPFTVRWVDVAVVLAVSLGLSLACAGWAAGRAAALTPVEALRR